MSTSAALILFPTSFAPWRARRIRKTLTDVIQARQQVTNVKVDPNVAPPIPKPCNASSKRRSVIQHALRLLVVVERYPELKANANFQELQAQLEGTENRMP